MPQTIIPNLSVDCVIFGFDSKDLNVLLVERTLRSEDGRIKFSDYTLTGNHVEIGEDPDKAAIRILNDLIGYHNIYLEQFHTFGSPLRLKNKKDREWIQSLKLNIPDHVITVGYYSLVNSTLFDISLHNNRKVRWFPVTGLPKLGFDHSQILKEALDRLQLKFRQEPIGFELLAEKFTLTEVQRLHEAVLGIRLDPRNFRKKLSQMKYIIPLNEKQRNVKHKPAQLFIYSRDVYERTRKDKYGYLI